MCRYRDSTEVNFQRKIREAIEGDLDGLFFKEAVEGIDGDAEQYGDEDFLAALVRDLERGGKGGGVDDGMIHVGKRSWFVDGSTETRDARRERRRKGMARTQCQ